jgi:predicted GIY-YIG superfamily endonuclease
LKEADGFASTYYNIPSTVVQRLAVHHQGKVSKYGHSTVLTD